MRTVAAVAAILLVAGTLTACEGEPRARLDRLVIAAGEAGDVYSALGRAFAEAAKDRLSVDAQVLTTGGSVDNLNLVAEGRADIGFATADAVANAAQGDLPFPSARPVVALARLYEDYLQIVTRETREIGPVSDLVGRTVSVGAPGSGTEVIATRVLAAAGQGLDDVNAVKLGPARSAEALRSGRVDAFFAVGGLPMPMLQQLAERQPIQLIHLEPDEVEDLQTRFGEYYQTRTIPVGAYGMEYAVETLGVPNILFVRRDMPEDVAYQLTELLFTEKDRLVDAHKEARRLDRRSALATFPVTLHPGAVQYYRESKVMASG